MLWPLSHLTRFTRPPSIALTLVVLFTLISGGAALLAQKQFQNSLDQAMLSDQVVARMTAMVVQKYEEATVKILESYGSRPLFVASAKNRDVAGAHVHLADLKKNNDEMDLTFVTDEKGLLWANYPVFPEALGQDLSHRDWYKGVSAEWRPYISTVFQLIVGDRPLAVAVAVPVFEIAVAVPVFDSGREVVAILANSHRLSTIDGLFKDLHADLSETIYLIDQEGHIVYNSKNSDIEELTAYPLYGDIKKAGEEDRTGLEIVDASDRQRTKFLALAPTDIGWTVVVERGLLDTLRSEYRAYLRIAAIAVLLFLLIAAFILHQNSLHEKALSMLQLERHRKTAEDALQKSQEKYRSLVENMLDGFASCRMLYDDRGHPVDFQYLDVNDAFARLTGLTDVVGKKFSEIFPGTYEGREELLERYSRVASTGNSEKFEFHFVPLALWFDLSVASHEKGDFLVVFSDITQRKLLAKQRQAALDLLRNLADRVPGVVFQCRLDASGNFTFPFISRGLEEIYRLSPEDVREDAAKIFAVHHPEDQYGFIASLHTSAREESPWLYEYRLKFDDGTVRWMSGSAMPQREEDGSTLWHGVIIDVTERKGVEDALRESETRLSTAARIAKFGVYAHDFESARSFYSPEFLALFGLPPGSQLELDEDLLAKALYPADKPAVLERVKAALDPGGPGTLEHEYRIARTDGEVRWQRVIGKTIFSGDRPLHAHGIIQDITARKRAEEELRTLNDELERRVEQRTRELQETQAHYLHAEKLSAIGKLSASISHEFNSPLQAVMTVLKGLMLNTGLEEGDRKLLQAAVEESKRMKNLTRSLQDFNRPSSGRKVLMDVHATIDSILLLCKSDFYRKKITTELRYVERMPQILAIPDQIKQVFLNLLNNAADACLSGGGVITITTCHGEEKVAVAIKDTGIGIPPEKIDLIFQPFYTTKPEIKGTGLGLSVCHGIVRNHQGEIRVESRPGEGSTFTVLLPVRAGDS